MKAAVCNEGKWKITDDDAEILSADEDDVIFVEDYESLRIELDVLYPAIDGFSFISGNTKWNPGFEIASMPIAQTNDLETLLEGARKYDRVSVLRSQIWVQRPSGGAYLATIDEDFIYCFRSSQLFVDKAKNQRLTRSRSTTKNNHVKKARMKVLETQRLWWRLMESVILKVSTSGFRVKKWGKPVGVSNSIIGIIEAYGVFKKLDLDTQLVEKPARGLAHYIPGLKNHKKDHYRELAVILEEIIPQKDESED